MSLPSPEDGRLWVVLLHEIDLAGGAALPKDLYPRLVGYFPAITQPDLGLMNRTGGSKWNNRVQWARQRLVARNLLSNATRGVWAITDQGRQWLEKWWSGPDADYSQSFLTSVPQVPTPRPPVSRTAVQKVPSPLPPPTIAVVTSLVDQICSDLRQSQRQSATPRQFEQAIAEAFTMLGFKSQHIGGSGQTDISLQAPLGQWTYSAVLDAKSTASGRVSAAQISWPAISSHRHARGATFVAVVGEDFSSGQLQQFASQFDVTLITTEMLCEILVMHSETPFSLIELRALFSQSGRADAALDTLRQWHLQHRRRWNLIAEVIDAIAVYGAYYPGFDAKIVHALLTAGKGAQSVANPLKMGEVVDSMTYLSCPSIGVLEELTGSVGSYQLVMSVDTARQRIVALASLLGVPTTQTAVPSASHAGNQPLF